MANPIILTSLDDSPDAERILDAFEQRTGLDADRRESGRFYELADAEHRERIVQTLTDIDERWTDHVGLRDPG
jgi:hypothetical protein